MLINPPQCCMHCKTVYRAVMQSIRELSYTIYSRILVNISPMGVSCASKLYAVSIRYLFMYLLEKNICKKKKQKPL